MPSASVIVRETGGGVAGGGGADGRACSLRRGPARAAARIRDASAVAAAERRAAAGTDPGAAVRRVAGFESAATAADADRRVSAVTAARDRAAAADPPDAGAGSAGGRADGVPAGPAAPAAGRAVAGTGRSGRCVARRNGERCAAPAASAAAASASSDVAASMRSRSVGGTTRPAVTDLAEGSGVAPAATGASASLASAGGTGASTIASGVRRDDFGHHGRRLDHRRLFGRSRLGRLSVRDGFGLGRRHDGRRLRGLDQPWRKLPPGIRARLVGRDVPRRLAADHRRTRPARALCRHRRASPAEEACRLAPDGGFDEAHLINDYKGDGKLTFDKLTDVYHSGTKHAEDQPCHLLIADTNICNGKCVAEYGNPCQHFCPAACTRWWKVGCARGKRSI